MASPRNARKRPPPPPTAKPARKKAPTPENPPHYRAKQDSGEGTDGKPTMPFHARRARDTYLLFHIGPEEKDWMIRRRDPPADPDRRPMPAHVAPLFPVAGPLPADDAMFAFEVASPAARR